MAAPGAVINDRYMVEDTIGTGGFATVYRATDLRFDSPVAIKELGSNFAADETIRSKFIAEARYQRQLQAPGLVVVHDIDENVLDGLPFIVMEYCASGTLESRLEDLERPLTHAEVLQLCDALAQATSGIHKANVVHRDLKPSNYLIRKREAATHAADLSGGTFLAADEEIVVGDFGLAREISLGATGLTFGGGTLGYAAPEQFEGDPTVDVRADIYALTAILAQALVGVPPASRLPNPIELPFDCADLTKCEPFSAVVERGLAYDRDDRYRNLDEWHDAIRTIGKDRTGVDKVTSSSKTDRRQSIVTGRQRKDRPRLLSLRNLVVLALAAALATALVLLRGGDGGTPTVIGPTSALVGDEVSFGTVGADEVTWELDGRLVATAPAISFTPLEPATHRLLVSDAVGSESVTLTVTERDSDVRIEGPSLVGVDQTATYSAIGGDITSGFTWSLDNTQIATSRAIKLTPDGPGTVTIELSVTGDRSLTRTITVLPP